ncbi:MAG: surface-adhesin E family protein [Rubrivivax sp.]
MTATASVDDIASGSQGLALSAAQWRALARLCRWIEHDEREAAQLFGPRARAAVKALREAQLARRRRQRGAGSTSRAAPTAVLATLADAAAQGAARRRTRSPGFYTPATQAIGTGLLLRLPELKTWLHQTFPLAAASPPQAPPEAAGARAREVLMQQCLALSDSEDGFHRRRHLLQLLTEHGYRQPLLRLVRRAAKDWAPKGWAENWEVLAGIDDDERALAAIDRACAAATPALQTWSRQPATAPAASVAANTPGTSPVANGPATPAAAASRPTPTAAPIVLRAWHSPSRLQWVIAGAAVLSVCGGVVLHLWPREGPAAARWVSFHESDGSTLSIDPDSIRRDGRQLVYRVGVVRSRENSSAVALYTANCDTRLRRLETVQHYRGTRFETPTRYEVRDASATAWPPDGADVRLLKAACQAASSPY